MKNFRFNLALAVSALAISLSANAASRSASLSSPDGLLRISISVDAGHASMTVSHARTLLIDRSPIGFDFEDGYFGDKIVSIDKGKVRSVKEEYDLPVGKTSHVCSVSNELGIALVDKSGRRVNMVLRAFDKGVAFRYLIPEQDGMEKLAIRNETMDIKPAGNPVAKVLFLPGFHNSHEGLYTTKPLSDLDEGRLMDMPLLLSYSNGYHVSITEANLVHYPGMYMVKKGDALTSRLSPRLDRPELSAIGDLPFKTPWRVFQVSMNPGDFIESNILTTLCDPCKDSDPSWVKPGKTTFTWWCDFQIPDTTWQRGNNFRSNKYYIDFAAEAGLEYHSVYGYANMPWYYDDGTDFEHAGPGADLTRPDSHLEFPKVCSYAREKGVDIHVWLNWAALWKDIDNVFDKFNEWGVKGMMVDFMDRDDQEMIEIQETILRKAMEHHLFIQFHGSSKPSGLHRTYPSEFTREGTYNYEVFKFSKGGTLDAAHDLNMPFTRGLAGPADYHLGGFRAVTPEEYHPIYNRPTVKNTRAHMLAMYVVLDSYLAMVADAPEAYRNQPGFEFIKAVPTSWDETRAPLAVVDEYVAVARKRSDTWYVGGISSNDPHDISLPLDFLGEGSYQVELFTDCPDTATDPNRIEKRIFNASASDHIDIRMAGSGGFAAIIRPL